MTIQVHYYEQRDGISVCRKCGKVENKDRTGPSWCSGRLPSIDLRAQIDQLTRERDEARAEVARASDGAVKLFTKSVVAEEAWKRAAAMLRSDYEARRFEVSVDDPETDVLEHIAKKVIPSLEQRAKIIARNRKERA